MRKRILVPMALSLLLASPLADGALAGGVLAAGEGRSLGIWQTTDRKMDYAVTLCGDGTQLCGQLVGLRDTADTPRHRSFLNQPLVDRIKPVGKNRWRGSVTMLGHRAQGTVQIHPGHSLVVKACVYVILCEVFTLIPAQ